MEKIKQALTGIIMAGSLALPQALDYVANGPYEVQRIGNSVIHEYQDRIIVTSMIHPWGTMLIDEGKDGDIDRYVFHAAPRVPFSMEIEPESELFLRQQERYAALYADLDNNL